MAIDGKADKTWLTKYSIVFKETEQGSIVILGAELGTTLGHTLSLSVQYIESIVEDSQL